MNPSPPAAWSRVLQLTALSLVLSAATHGQSALAPDDSAACSPAWVPTFGGAPGMTAAGRVGVVFDDGTGDALYVAGYITAAGGVPVNHIAKWDGTSWSPLGQGLEGPNPIVWAVATFDDGTGTALYAAGTFTTAGGVAAENIAKWDGTSWSPLGTGTDNQVQALIVHDDGTGPALYASGSFGVAGGVVVDNVARWDGMSWSALGATPGIVSSASSLAVFDDGSGPELYAGGQFSISAANHSLAKWDGANWIAVTNTLFQTYSLAVWDDGTGEALYVGGSFSTGTPGNRVAKWDGTTWSGLGSGLDDAVQAIAALDDGGGTALFAIGKFKTAGGVAADSIAKWDGTAWSALGTGLGKQSPNSGAHQGWGLAGWDDGSGSKVYAIGGFDSADGVAAIGIAAWDGAAWSAVGPQGVSQGVQALATIDDGTGAALYAGGGFTSAGGTAVDFVGRWDGSSWSSLAGGLDGPVYCLGVFDDGGGAALYAGGAFTSAGGVSASNIAKWDGTSWSALGAGLDWGPLALAVFDDGTGAALFATGYFTTAGGAPANYIAKWDGTAWSALGTGLGNIARSLAVYDDGTGAELFVGGWFSTAGGVNSTGSVAKWDGTTWSSVGGAVLGSTYALAVFDDGSGAALYAGGNVNSAGGVPVDGFAKWDGTTWSAPLGVAASDGIFSMAAHDDGSGSALYAGGIITVAGGVAVENIARFDGATWSAVGGDMPGIAGPMAFASYDDGTGLALFAGGGFELSGGGDSFLAKWGCPSPSGPTTYCTAGTSANGCQALLAASGTPSATATSGFTLSASGVEGGKDGLFFFGTNGKQANAWGSGTSFQCVVPPVKRAGLLSGTGTPGLCDAAFAQDLNALWCPTCPNPAKNPGAGAVVQAQLWYRDPQNTSNQTTSLSDAIEFFVAP